MPTNYWKRRGSTRLIDH